MRSGKLGEGALACGSLFTMKDVFTAVDEVFSSCLLRHPCPCGIAGHSPFRALLDRRGVY